MNKLFVNKIKALLKIFAVSSLLLVASTNTLYAKSDFSLRGDPNFSASNLPSDMRLWHTRLWGGLNKGTGMYPNAVGAGSSGELYAMARTWQTHMDAMLAAFRATGDLAILDNLDAVMQQARAKLKDVWSPECSQYPISGKPADYKCTYQKDGFLNFYYWASVHTEQNQPSATGTRSTYFGWDTHDMDESMTHAAIAEFTYALRVNQDLKTQYKDHANFWQNYLANHFEAKWKKRQGKLPQKYLTHAYASFTKYYYYMYKLTGNASYLSEANSRMSTLKSIMKTASTSKGTAYTWDHGVPLSSSYPYGCQPSWYGALTISVISEFAMEGFGPFASDSEMAKFSNTAYGNIYKNGASGPLTGTVCGSGTDSNFSRATIYSYMAAMPWDTSGGFMPLMKTIYEKQQGTGDPKSPLVPAYMIAAIAKKNGFKPSGTNVPLPSGTPLPVKGDGNGDSIVDGIDYLIYVINNGRTSVTDGARSGDYNNDRSVNNLDYDVWKGEFN